MSVLQHLEPKQVFRYFEEISAIPRGSGNMEGISAYCMEFAKAHGFRAVCDNAKNVVIFKNATSGYENAAPIILQGHLDMVCQKTSDSNIDFEKDGISLKLEGSIICADGTTLGADNGIAVAMVLAILDSSDIPHPAIEAVFTTDEEIGMVGALALDTSVLSAKRMINLDSEEEDCMTVSCAGGSDFNAKLAAERKAVSGHRVSVKLLGLRGGHSGVCIHEGRVNANILAGRFLSELSKKQDFDLISVNGGDKGNAITPMCEIQLCVSNAEDFCKAAEEILCALKEEMSAREPDFAFEVKADAAGQYSVLSQKSKSALIHALVCTPNGVLDMSADIDGLVETSLNLGILQTSEDFISFSYALRSNKNSALRFLEAKMEEFFSVLEAKVEIGGQYPPWEFNRDSSLQGLYIDAYKRAFDKDVRVEAIHAGLECGVFADKIQGFDCIAIGPDAADVHTVNEHLDAGSVERIFTLLKAVLADCK